MKRVAVDLLDAVSAGVTAVGDADRMSKQAQAVDGAPEEAPKPPSDSVEEVVRDAERNEVPKNLEDVFKSVSSFRVMDQYLADAINAAEKIAGSDAATWFDAETFIAAVKGCQKIAKESRPHIMCADCAGKGRQRYAREDCPRCKGSGFVSKGFLKAEKKAAGQAESEE
jgi:DnaJ-class molecular chaperone